MSVERLRAIAEKAGDSDTYGGPWTFVSRPLLSGQNAPPRELLVGSSSEMDHQPPPAVVRHKLPPDEQWQWAVRDNPHLPDAIADTARQLIGQGRRATMNVIAEELRERLRTVGDVYRFNNTWRAPAGAWLKTAHPELAGDIRTRRSPR